MEWAGPSGLWIPLGSGGVGPDGATGTDSTGSTFEESPGFPRARQATALGNYRRAFNGLPCCCHRSDRLRRGKFRDALRDTQTFCFDKDGRHRSTRDARTGEPLLSFNYTDGLLTSVVDTVDQTTMRIPLHLSTDSGSTWATIPMHLSAIGA